MAIYPRVGPFPGHELFVALGVAVAVVVFVIEARRRWQTDEKLIHVVAGGLVGGALMMRLGAWLGVHVAKRLDDAHQCAPFCAVQAWLPLSRTRLSTATGGTRWPTRARHLRRGHRRLR